MLDWSKVLLSSNNSVSPFCFSFLFVYLHLQASFGVKMLKRKKKSQINCILLQQYPGKEIKMKYLTYNQKFLPTLTAEEDETPGTKQGTTRPHSPVRSHLLVSRWFSKKETHLQAPKIKLTLNQFDRNWCVWVWHQCWQRFFSLLLSAWEFGLEVKGRKMWTLWTLWKQNTWTPDFFGRHAALADGQMLPVVDICPPWLAKQQHECSAIPFPAWTKTITEKKT